MKNDKILTCTCGNKNLKMTIFDNKFIEFGCMKHPCGDRTCHYTVQRFAVDLPKELKKFVPFEDGEYNKIRDIDSWWQTEKSNDLENYMVSLWNEMIQKRREKIRRDKQVCPKCGMRYKDEWNYCPICGTTVERIEIDWGDSEK